MTPAVRERALAGAAILDHAVARLLLAELDEEQFEDPAARLVLRVLREGLRADELFYRCEVLDEDLPEPPPGWVPPSDLEIVLQALDCSGRQAEAGGAAAVAALVEDRPELREALVAGRAALAAMSPLESEPVVEFATELLG